MPSKGRPRHRANPPGRWIAGIGAVTVTVLAVSGALGLIPTTTAAQAERVGDTAKSTDPAQPGDDQESPDVAAEEPTTTQSEPDTVGSTPPPVPADSGTGRRVVYDISAQRVWLVQTDGTVARTYLVSGARNQALLDPGSYEVYSKSLEAVALNHRETMKFMVRFAHGDRAAIGFHDIPMWNNGTLAQTRQELGTPQSAGCIRQWRPDAKALYKFTRIGSTVTVIA